MILYHFTRNTNMFLLTISFSLLLLFNSIFSTMNIKNKIQEYYDNKYYYSNKKILKGSIIFIGIITIILMLISYLIGLLINIKGITLVNISMCIYLFTNNIIKLESEYFSIGKYKKLGNNLINIYKITNIILTIITIIILYKVLNLDNYINIFIETAGNFSAQVYKKVNKDYNRYSFIEQFSGNLNVRVSTPPECTFWIVIYCKKIVDQKIHWTYLGDMEFRYPLHWS